MQGFWIYRTRWGTFGIVPSPDGRWRAMFESDDLGSYWSAETALDDLVSGSTIWPNNGLDPSLAGLPDDLSEWTFMPTR